MKLYHYCSVEALLGIIKSKSIWLSDLRQTNDGEELKCGEKAILEAWRKKFKEKPESFDKETQDLIYESAYAFCLSKLPDKLSQWRGYADDGTGVCIGFDLDAMGIRRQHPNDIPFKNNCIGYEQVVYENETFFDNKLDEMINDKVSFKNIGGDDKWYRFIEFGKYKFFYKNKGFKEEQEYRIVFIDPTARKLTKDEENSSSWLDLEFYSNQFYPLDNKLPKGPFFRHRNNRIVCYFEYSFADYLDKAIIKDIILGPLCKISKEYMNFILEKNDLKPISNNIQIRSSDCSYRK